MSEPLGDPPCVRPALSPRETQVLLVWLHRDSKAATARTLSLSVATVTTHLARIRAKYAAAARPAPTKAALFARAIQDHLVTLDEW